MSYVLDALRRAEAERQRGHVPGLHAQTLPAPEVAADFDAGPTPRAWLPWAAAALVVGGLGVAVMWWWGGSAAPVEADSAPVVAKSAPPPPLVVPRPVRPPPVVRAAPQPAPRTAPVADNPDRVVKFDDLPDAIRRQIPALAFGGATHSPQAAARMLIINGQIWREGEEPAPGLRLELIELRSARFRFRDHRFEVSY